MQVDNSVLNEMLTDEASVNIERIYCGKRRKEIFPAEISRERVGRFDNNTFRVKIKQLEREQLISRESIERIKHMRKEERNRLSSARYNRNRIEEERVMTNEIEDLKNTRLILLMEKEYLKREIKIFQNITEIAYQPPNIYSNYMK